jgi:hypothetical protein
METATIWKLYKLPSRFYQKVATAIDEKAAQTACDIDIWIPDRKASAG